MTKRLGIAEALREAIAEEMERDDRVFCIGKTSPCRADGAAPLP